ncbi:MAG TPA: DoxX family protein [Byssovorax sp.]|jgi:hypothetical protein
MKTTKTVYRVTTGLIVLVMCFSMYMMFTPGWERLGFPSSLRIELVIGKIAGLVALLAPGVPARVKEWAYAGFAIVLVSASVAHAHAGDPTASALEPLVFLAILVASNVTWRRLAGAPGARAKPRPAAIELPAS